jgi:hypothetical protein
VVGGGRQARNVEVGSKLWSLDGARTVQTTVVGISAVKAREVVDVVTDRVTFTVAPRQELRTTEGWVPAVHATGTMTAWTHARKLFRERPTIVAGYDFGYFVGATCADGTVGKNYVSLVANDESFASRYAECLTTASGSSRHRHLRGLSGRLRRRRRLPEPALIIGARFTPRPKGTASALVITVRWQARGTFTTERHPLEPVESAWVEVRDVRLRRAVGTKPFTLYGFRLDPHPGFLVNGHLARQGW